MKTKIPLTICLLVSLLALSPSLMAQGKGDGEKDDETTEATPGKGKGKKGQNAGETGKAEGGNPNKKNSAEPKQNNPGKANAEKPPEKLAEPKPDRPANQNKADNPDRPKKSASTESQIDKPKNPDADKPRDDSPKKSAQADNDGPKNQQQKKDRPNQDNPNLTDGNQEGKKNREPAADDSPKNNKEGKKNDGDNVVNDNSKSQNNKNVDIDNDRKVKIDEDNRKNVNIDKDRNVKIDTDNSRHVDVDKDRNVKNIDKSKTSNTEINKSVTNINIDRRPGKGDRPPRTERKREWNDVHVKNTNNWNQWRQKNEVTVVKFKQERQVRWTRVVRHDNDWPRHYHDNNYRVWRRDVWDYRRDRAAEIWDRRQDRWDDAFDDHWWGTASWRRTPRVYAANVSPWWWWRPYSRANVTVFFGDTVAAQPVIYDPGTTVIYEGDNYYVDGEVRGNARVARQSARALAYPQVAEVPVPEPAEEGQVEEWQPLGVWALTQQEEGDANMFMQLSVNRDGIVAGAYKNVMTGDEQPIVGQLDKKEQRLAWHVGEASDTVYETGLSNLENDVASVFVHLGESDTQTWLLVRLPSPEIPPTIVKIPDYVAQN